MYNICTKTINTANISTEILGHVIDSNSSDEFLSRLRLEKIGFVFQTFNLLATLSAFENVELPMTVLGKLSKEERKARAKELLTRTYCKTVCCFCYKSTTSYHLVQLLGCEIE